MPIHSFIAVYASCYYVLRMYTHFRRMRVYVCICICICIYTYYLPPPPCMPPTGSASLAPCHPPYIAGCSARADATVVHLMRVAPAPPVDRPYYYTANNVQAGRPRARNHHCCTPVFVTWLYYSQLTGFCLPLCQIHHMMMQPAQLMTSFLSCII